MSGSLFVYVTFANAEEAEKIARMMVEEKLAACANVFQPHKALYWWDGGVQEGQEIAVIFKTRRELFDVFKGRIVALHSYEVPCVVALPINLAHEPFLQWITENTG